MEFQEPVKERFTYNSSQEISKIQIRFSGCRESSVRQRGYGYGRGLYCFLFQRKRRSSIGKSIFVHHKIMSMVK
jgi:hypothetical protein